MPPELARHLILKYSLPKGLIFDPFCGKGTVLLEAVLNDRYAVGLDVAPDAIVTSNAKLHPPTMQLVKDFLSRINFRGSPNGSVPANVRLFYSSPTLDQILKLRQAILHTFYEGTQEQKRTANFALGLLLGLLHGHSTLSLSISSSHSFAMAPRYVEKYARAHKLERPERNVIECVTKRASQLLPSSPFSGSGAAYLGKAEKYPLYLMSKLNQSVDLIVTSPPYLDMQTYAKDAWLRLWLLGHDYRSLGRTFIQTGSPRVYLSKMVDCMQEMLKVLKDSGHVAIVAGDAPYFRKGKRRWFKTALELAKLGAGLNLDGFTFRIKSEAQDSIPASRRYYASVHKDGKAGNRSSKRKGVKIERIVVLQKVKVRKNSD